MNDDEFLRDVVYVVEATGNEKSNLWLEYHCNHKGITWEDDGGGLLLTIGELADMPVCISLFKSDILGQTVLFSPKAQGVPPSRQTDRRIPRPGRSRKY